MIKGLKWSEPRRKLKEKNNDLKLDAAVKIALEYQAIINNTDRFEQKSIDTCSWVAQLFTMWLEPSTAEVSSAYGRECTKCGRLKRLPECIVIIMQQYFSTVSSWLSVPDVCVWRLHVRGLLTGTSRLSKLWGYGHLCTWLLDISAPGFWISVHLVVGHPCTWLLDLAVGHLWTLLLDIHDL